MKQKLMNKENAEDLKNKLLIRKKIEELKELFQKKRYNKVGELYAILVKIVQLKQGDLKPHGRYTSRSLEWEKGIDLKGCEIRYIFSYEFFSEKSHELIKQKKIKDATICFLVWRFAFLKESRWQNDLVKMYLENKIKISEIGEMSEKELKKSIINKKVCFSEKERKIVQAIKSVRAMRSRFNFQGIYNSKSTHKEVLIKELKKMIGDLNGS